MPGMSEQEIWDFLTEGTRTAHVATTRSDGRPHVKLVWFVLDGRPGAAQESVGNLPRTLAAAHDVGDLVGFEQTIHAAAEAVLIAMDRINEVFILTEVLPMRTFFIEFLGMRSVVLGAMGPEYQSLFRHHV